MGWTGEIWVRTNERWEAQDTGTNTHLNAVSVVPEGQVVAVGDDGTVIVGRSESMVRPRHQYVDFNFQGVCHFGRRSVPLPGLRIYRLGEGPIVGETRFANGEEPKTCMNLLPGKESVFSQGEKDIFKYSARDVEPRLLDWPGGPTDLVERSVSRRIVGASSIST